MSTLRAEPGRSLQRLIRRPHSSALSGALVTLVLLTSLWYVGSRWYQARLVEELRTRVAVETSVRGNALSLAVTRRMARLQALYAFVQTETADGHEFARDFDTFAAQLYAGSQGIRYLAAAPAGVVRDVYPPGGNEALADHDLINDPRPDIRADVQRAIRLRVITLSGPYEQPQGEAGLIARLAIFQDDDFWGLVTMGLEIAPLLSEAGLDLPSDELDFALRDPSQQVFFGPPEVFASDPVIHRVDLPEGMWELAGVPVGGWQASVQRPVLILRVGGFVIVLLLSGLAYLSVNRQAQLAQAVRQRTQEIARINLALEKRVEERTQELATLLRVSHSVASTLELKPLISLVLKQLKEVVDYDAAAVFGVQGKQSLILLDYHGPGAADDQPRLRDLHSGDPCAEVIRQGTPLIITDVQADTPLARAWRDAHANRPGTPASAVSSWLGVPLIVKNRIIGMLTLEHEQKSAYTEQHAELVLAFADQAAVGIENARLYEQAQRLAALEERQKLARELHDSVSQALYGIALGARTARAKLARDPAEAAQPLDYVLSMAEAGLAEMRSLIFELRPETLQDEGLGAALNKQAAALRARHGLDVQLALGDEPDLPDEAKHALYRIAQEALQNVIKHARASRVDIRLDRVAGSIVLEVQDNGKGFEATGPFPGHFGLISMRERAEQLGGTFQVESAPGTSTTVRVQLPVWES